ncbi:MAG: hypothetical protein Q4G69_04145 [Planctomycetia bacterium]|nr:hypothetical protein [Planctomycetia bacterium]
MKNKRAEHQILIRSHERLNLDGKPIGVCRSCFLYAFIFGIVLSFFTSPVFGQVSFNFQKEVPEGTGNSVRSPLSVPMISDFEMRQSGQNRFYTPSGIASDKPIAISSSYGWKGNDAGNGEVYILVGDCRVQQGTDIVSGPRAVVWIRRKENTKLDDHQVLVYLEKENPKIPLQIELNSVFVEAQTNNISWFGHFRSRTEITMHIKDPGTNQIDPEQIYFRAEQMRSRTYPSDGVQVIPQTSRLTEGSITDNPALPSNVPFRRIRILSRHDAEMTLSMQPDPNDPNKRLCTINYGVTLVVEGVNEKGKIISDIIDISADRAVIWAAGINQLGTDRESTQSSDLDLELYLEGDIVFREGDRIIYAKKMYYDAKNKVGLIQDTEMVIPIPQTVDGYFRVKADSVEQNGEDKMLAKNAWVSTSMMGNPSYRLQSNLLRGESRNIPLYDPITQQPKIDPETGLQATKKEHYLIAENNYVAVDSVPIFYWPWMAMDTRDQTLYLRSLQVGHDSIFGYQARTTWNPYQLLNMGDCRPEGTDWDLNLDYLSDRGLGHGMSFLYNRESLFGFNTPAIGMINFYGISDKGTDNLGRWGRNVPFPHSYRYRTIWKHRQIVDLPQSFGCLSDDWVITGQFGKSSDRNFLPQYFEEEWYSNPNPETSLEMKKTVNNWSFGLSGAYRLDKFYTQTNTLPRLDHYWLGQPLFTNKLIWYEHTKLAYSQFRTTDAPASKEQKDYFRYLDWELDPNSTSNSPYDSGTSTLSANSFNFSTRHELDVPLDVGPLKVVPYGLGEYAFWGTELEKKNMNRLYGRGGVRVNLPVWKVDSSVSSNTWYLNGIAHKMNLVMDASYSEANKNMSDLILYEQLDDWQIEDFRRRYSVYTYGGIISPQFDERGYALRQGALGGMVSSPSTEIADDLRLVRFEWQNRWQTKRGPVGKRHTIDWITFNTGINFYPRQEDNFGKNVGLLDYEFRWHVGDRFSVLSSGLYDFFEDGQKITRVGAMAKRPWLGNIYVGVDQFSGPIKNTYLNAALNYRMSEKWAFGISNSYDLNESENIGQSGTITRIGESFVFTLKFNVNTSKDNWGVSLNMIPVFLLNPKKVEDGVFDVRHL